MGSQVSLGFNPAFAILCVCVCVCVYIYIYFFFFLCVPELEDRTGGLLAAGTEDMASRGPEPVPSTSVHYTDRDCTPDPHQEKGGSIIYF